MEIYDPTAEFTDGPICECGKHFPTEQNGGA